MSTASSNDRRAESRSDRIRRIVFEVARQRAEGSEVHDGEILARHPELLPELEDQLRKLGCIRGALKSLEEQEYLVTLERIEADCDLHLDIGSETDDYRPGVPPSDPDPAVEALSTIGRYRVTGVLGEGGFARVYLASDDELRRDVAIKVPNRPRGTDPDEMETYWAEARIVAALDHPAIVPVYDVGRTRDGHCYVVSKLIGGENLSAKIRRSRLSHDEAVRIVIVVADALHYAHAQGLVHRDIKPANILLDALGRPYVVDFGLALTETDSRDGSSYAGTPGYMSPEQARGEAHRVDPRSDIFSLGVVLYELITGRKPFQAESYDALLERILWEEPSGPRSLDESISEELERICLKAMSKRSADRYATAKEFVDDLSHLANASVNSVVSPVAVDDQLDSGANIASDATPRVPKIIPKGLRAFDAKDADYYLGLVPGPRDRHGLPQSIRQWKTRIEEMDPAETFPVGLLYGPSGCGKSSLVRAGLLPRLSPMVRSVYIEATADDTEGRLLARIKHQIPDLSDSSGLAECLAEIRRGHGMAKGEKMLLVIDQFEQWLHGRAERDRRELLAALRQCDGARLQCLLSIRDDFWLAVGRFMAELEVDLVHGFNSALVDLFDTNHARKVFAEFGRAFGQLPDNLSKAEPAHETFLQRAIASLAQEERIVPVRLALFAEMVKGRPWTPDTLRQVGGAEGVGVAFLEEAFGAKSANPRYRIHQQAARAVLGALLPARGADIRGRVCSNSELLDISGYGKKPRQFRELMRILDSETRLLTPMDLDAIDTEDLQTAPGHRYYQLTHDFLVPALRQWLTAKQRSTRSGRMELRLAERARLWNSRPERRQLPSLIEWCAIRILTRPTQWSAAQRRVMRAALRHHARTLFLVVGLLFAVLYAGNEVTSLARHLSAKLRAKSTVIWMVAGMDETVWPLFRRSANPTVRTEVIHEFTPMVTSPEHVVAELQNQTDVGIRQAMVLVVGELIGSPEDGSTRSAELHPYAPLAQVLLQLYRQDPDPGIHSAAQWTLQRYQSQSELARIDRELTSTRPVDDRQWYVTQQGHTMVVVPGWTQFMMGSDGSDRDRADDERRRDQRIRRTFCIANRETTIEQYNIFAREAAGIFGDFAGKDNSEPLVPVSNVSWYEAAAYCNWLSLKEGLPRAQWCYLPNADGQFGPGLRIARDYIERRGYRLPTEAEWEFACRAGTTSTRYFGDAASWLKHYAAYLTNADGNVQPVGLFKPNDLGLFDSLGNVAEWCQDDYRADSGDRAVSKPGELFVRKDVARVVRGGSCADRASRLRSAARAQSLPDQRRSTLGFRVAQSNL